MITSSTIKVLDYLEVLDYLQELEFKKLNIPIEPICNNSYRLPNGLKAIKNRMNEYIIKSCYGNQQFCNDSLFRLQLSDCIEEDNRDFELYFVNEYDEILFKEFKEHVNGERYDRFFIFNVSW